MQNQLSQLSTTQSTSSFELTSLRRKVEETEREKRDLMSVINRLEEDAAQREEEVVHLRDSLKAVRKEQQELETASRELRSAETSTKVRGIVY